ncbi:MAG: hypothetical protein WC455_28705 [Dehalococcoidia bacterium]|jgi:hypothetical protein
MPVCDVCGIGVAEANEDNAPPAVCQACHLKYPPALLKANADQFSYVLGLRDGTVVDFESAEIHGEWITIIGVNDTSGLPGMSRESDDSGLDPDTSWKGRYCLRGVDIRLSEIVWIADAPNGS